MKRLNNHGFAVTTMVYSLLLLAVFIIFLMLKNTVRQKELDDEFIKNVETQLNESIFSGS